MSGGRILSTHTFQKELKEVDGIWCELRLEGANYCDFCEELEQIFLAFLAKASQWVQVWLLEGQWHEFERDR